MQIKPGTSSTFVRWNMSVFSFILKGVEGESRIFTVSCTDGKYEVNEMIFGCGEPKLVKA